MEENRRKDEIIMRQAITMRALSPPTQDAPPETSEAPQSATEGADKGGRKLGTRLRRP
jgi:hypothetical protein